jgi:elongation factor G
MALDRLRNIGIVAHIDAGKTTVTERMLHLCGVEHRVGRVDEGTATMDWMAEERERGITITSAATRVVWQGVAFNVIDTPGHVDFTVEVERCMRVLDGAVLVIDAVAGVQAQSETVWRQMARHQVPCVCFVNKCDKPGADVLAASATLQERLGARGVPVAYPVTESGQVVGVVDLLRRQAWAFDPDGKRREIGIPEQIQDEVEVLRAELVDTLAEEDEALMEAVLEEREPSVDDLLAAMRARVVTGDLVPVLCGSALRGVGVQPLLDAVVDWLPSPLDRRSVEGFDPQGEPLPPRGPDPQGSLTTLAFKIHSSTFGDLTFVRVYAGTLTPGTKLWNPRTRTMERPGRVLRMHADHGEAVESAGPGEIVALVGLKNTGTGDTLCDRAEPILLEPPVFPEPVIALVVEPASSGDRDRLRAALARLGREDPSFRVTEDEGTGQWTIEGMGELHLEVVLHRLKDEFKVDARVGKPRVSYREAITGSGRASALVDRALGGKEVFGGLEVELSPRTSGVVVEWAEGLDLPAAFAAAVEEALRGEALSGPRFGFPLVAAGITVVGVQRHKDKETETAFALAATLALREAMKQAPASLLEPRMSFDIQCPEEFSSGIIADLGARRAEVGQVVADGDLRTVTGTVALAQMFGYSTAVRSLSQGRASWSMTPAGFVEVPEAELEARGLTWA